MFSLNDSMRYYLSVGSCDLRKGFDSLSGVVRGEMGRDPLSGKCLSIAAFPREASG
jgi:hypothetical protein